ncbi:MAG: hypothetical protein LBB80_07260, partial [Treponema sp.]|nr:hypothetical protein [Treponema sp.]
MRSILCFLQKYSNVIQVLSAAVTIFLAVRIPRRILINQLYVDLIQAYRSPEIGAAIFAIFRFYVKDCHNNTAAMAGAYREKYKEQIEGPLTRGEAVDYANTLHFQRRLVAQFYWNMAVLRYERRFPRLSTKELILWFTPNDAKLLALLLHMAEPAKKVFEEALDVPEPPEDEV